MSVHHGACGGRHHGEGLLAGHRRHCVAANRRLDAIGGGSGRWIDGTAHERRRRRETGGGPHRGERGRADGGARREEWRTGHTGERDYT